MKIAVFFLLYTSAVYGREGSLVPAASDPNFLSNLHDEYHKEFKCLERIDDILSSKWTQDLEKIPTKDLGDLKPEFRIIEPSKPMYNTVEQEWLMESGSSAKQLDTCVRGLVSSIVPLMNQGEIDCLNAMFAHHIEEEFVHEDIFVESLRESSKEQLPFRRFISFPQFVEMMYQSRTPDALDGTERSLYEHAESYLTTDKDRVDRTFIMEQDCEWKNARKLRESSGEEKFLEFGRQVRDSVNQQFGNRLVRDWRLNTTLSRERYTAWLQARRQMESRVNAEVEKLRGQKKDAQTLCEHATKFAYELSNEQADILFAKPEGDNNFHFAADQEKYFSPRVSEVAEKARTIAEAMKKAKDFRQPVLEVLAGDYEAGAQCLIAFLHLVQNHGRFDRALGFMDGMYNYPEFYCKSPNNGLDQIGTRFCKCVGSFCVAHGLAFIFSKRYVLTQDPDGTYRVVLSGLNSWDKVQSWDRD